MTRVTRMTVYGAATLVLLAAVSTLLLLALRNGSERRVLFFPEFASRKLIGEIRYVPHRRQLTGDVRLVVEEAILGPADHRALRLLPRTVRVLSVHVVERTAFVNLSRHVLFDPTQSPSTGEERLQALANTVLFNFPRLQLVRLLVEGQEPHLAADQLAFSYDPSLLK